MLLSNALAVQVSAEEGRALLAQLQTMDVALVNELFHATMAAAAADAHPPTAELSPVEDVTSVDALTAIRN
jgi:hypothetical protein